MYKVVFDLYKNVLHSNPGLAEALVVVRPTALSKMLQIIYNVTPYPNYFFQHLMRYLNSRVP